MYFWERSIFGPEKRMAATKSHPGWNTQVESNLAPLGFQAGGPTTRPTWHPWVPSRRPDHGGDPTPGGDPRMGGGRP